VEQHGAVLLLDGHVLGGADDAQGLIEGLDLEVEAAEQHAPLAGRAGGAVAAVAQQARAHLGDPDPEGGAQEVPDVVGVEPQTGGRALWR
jgi:hypothetical protein